MPADEDIRLPVYETMTRIDFARYQIRVWRDSTPRYAAEDRSNPIVDFTMGPDRDVLSLAHEIEKKGHSGVIKEVLKALLKLPRINAVEIVDSHGNGGLYYPEWP